MRVTAAKDGVLIRRRLRIFAAAVALVLLCAVCVGGVSGADGNWDDYADTTWGQDYNDETVLEFYIEDAGDLAQFASMVNSGKDFSRRTVILKNNIDLQNQEWKPIGDSSSNPFRGRFDGAGHYIDNIYITYNRGSTSGLFGYVESGIICNLDILNIEFMNNDNARDSILGSFVGNLKTDNNNGYIENCRVLGKAVFNTHNHGTGSYIVGGLIGEISDSSISVTTENIELYLRGTSFVHINPDVDYNKPWGLLVGYPLIGSLTNNGGSGGTNDDGSAKYIVQYFKRVGGDYVQISNDDENEFVGVVGQTVTAEYEVPDGYFLSEDSVISGVVGNGKEGGGPLLVLKVYYDIISYQVTIPPTLPIYEDIKTGWTSISVSNMRIPSNSAIIVYLEDCDFKLEHQLNSDATLSYVLVNGDGTDLYSNPLVGQFTMADHDPLELTATVYGQASYAGQYTDTVTFTWELATIA